MAHRIILGITYRSARIVIRIRSFGWKWKGDVDPTSCNAFAVRLSQGSGVGIGSRCEYSGTHSPPAVFR